MLAVERLTPVKLAPVEFDGAASDYEIVQRAIAYVTEHFRDQPDVETVARAVGVDGRTLTELFRRWCGLSPKAFLQSVTLDYARRVLRESPNILEASYEVGSALVMTTERGLCGLAFADQGGEQAALADMRGRWPNARYAEDSARTVVHAQRIFDSKLWRPNTPLRVVLIGTDFEIRVWETLLSIPMGKAATYSDIAKKLGNPKGARAVGAAVGKNPVSFVVPCHRVVGKSGNLTGYHWGLTRKRAMLGWEAAQVAA